MIRDRGKDSWQVVVYVGRDPITNKERHIRHTVRGTKTDARNVERTLQVQVTEGKLSGTEDTVGVLLDSWLKHAAPALSPKTVYNYRRLIETRIRPAIGPVKVTRLTPATLDGFYDALRADLSAKTIRNVHAIVHRALDQAVRHGWIAINPASNAEPPKVVRTEISPPDVAQVQRLLKHVAETDPDFATYLRLAAATGCRRGELCALRWRDLDVSAGSLLVERSLIAAGGTLVEKPTKTNRARRVALGTATLAALTEHHDRILTRVADAGYTALAPDGHIFANHHGQAWHPDTLTQRFRRHADALGLKIRLHDLRHFHVTQLLAAGEPVRQVADRVGHANANMTLGVYGHAIPGGDRRAATTIDRLIDT